MPGKPRITTAGIRAEISSRKRYHSTNKFGKVPKTNKVRVKVSSACLLRHYAKNTYGGVEV